MPRNFIVRKVLTNEQFDEMIASKEYDTPFILTCQSCMNQELTLTSNASGTKRCKVCKSQAFDYGKQVCRSFKHGLVEAQEENEE